MSLLTIPALIGPICGPPLGGFITTYASWHWIFIINVPIGLVGIALATRYIPNVRAEYPYPFDFVGFLLSGVGDRRTGLRPFGAGLEFLPDSVVAALLGVGAVAGDRLCDLCASARRRRSSISSLLKLPTFRASIFGGFMFRLGVGAMPFLLPLLLQIGFGLSPFQSGLITFTSALGSMFMKAAATTVLKRFGYRNVLLYNSLVSAVFIGACASFVPGMPFCGDDRHSACRRLFPLAAIHQRQHHRLCGDRAAGDEPRHLDGRRIPAIVAVDRRRRRRAGGRDHAAAQACTGRWASPIFRRPSSPSPCSRPPPR